MVNPGIIDKIDCKSWVAEQFNDDDYTFSWYFVKYCIAYKILYF